MPLTTNLQIEFFDVLGIDYMGPFPKSGKFEYILVVVDYVSKWLKPCHAELLTTKAQQECLKRQYFLDSVRQG
jgi:hypothetical protein